MCYPEALETPGTDVCLICVNGISKEGDTVESWQLKAHAGVRVLGLSGLPVSSAFHRLGPWCYLEVVPCGLL